MLFRVPNMGPKREEITVSVYSHLFGGQILPQRHVSRAVYLTYSPCSAPLSVQLGPSPGASLQVPSVLHHDGTMLNYSRPKSKGSFSLDEFSRFSHWWAHRLSNDATPH